MDYISYYDAAILMNGSFLLLVINYITIYMYCIWYLNSAEHVSFLEQFRGAQQLRIRKYCFYLRERALMNPAEKILMNQVGSRL